MTSRTSRSQLREALNRCAAYIVRFLVGCSNFVERFRLFFLRLGGEGLKEGDEFIGFHGTIERECRCLDSVQSEYSFLAFGEP
jgi:hypothetical protein